MGRNLIIKNWKWVALTLIFWFIALQCIPRQFSDLVEDSAQYIILAESISKGVGLRMINYPGEPLSFYFPPVLCFLISPIIYFFGRNFYLMHILIAALGFFSLYFLYQLFKRFSDRFIATLCVLLLASNWAFITFSTGYILSDIPYLFFSSFTLFMVTRYSEEGSYFNKYGLFVIIGLLLSYFTRYSGLVLFLSIMVFLLLKRKGNRLGKVVLIGSVFLLVFAAWNVLELLYASRLASHNQLFFLIDPYNPDKGSILAHPFELARRFTEGVNRVYVLLADITFFYFMKRDILFNDFICGVIMIFVLLGFWFKFRKDRYCVFHYYFILYLLLIFLWIFTEFMEGVRYLLPVLPFMIFYFLIGIQKVLNLFPKRFYYVCFSIIICIFFIFSARNLAKIPKSSQVSLERMPVKVKNFFLLHDWINKNLTDKETILSRKPTITYLYTNHKAVVYPYTSSAEKIWQEIAKDNVKYIIVDEFTKETYYYLLPFLYKYKDKLKLLYQVGETRLFEIKQRG